MPPEHDQPLPSETQVLLRKWHGGDHVALDALVRKNAEWIERYVRARLGDKLRSKDSTQDIVQEALVEFLRYGPRFELQNEIHFRGLVAKIVRNVLADRHAWFTRRRRDMHRERGLPEHSTLCLDPGARSVTQPPQAMARDEDRELIRLALELLRPEDREVIVRRHFDGEEFGAIAAAMQSTAEATRKRFGRALPKLFATVKRLRDGEIEAVLTDEGD